MKEERRENNAPGRTELFEGKIRPESKTPGDWLNSRNPFRHQAAIVMKLFPKLFAQEPFFLSDDGAVLDNKKDKKERNENDRLGKNNHPEAN